MSPKVYYDFKPPLGYCGDCIWCKEQGGFGQCHRMPPMRDVQVQVEGTSNTFRFAPVWPMVDPHDWCGEFTPKAAETTESERPVYVVAAAPGAPDSTAAVVIGCCPRCGGKGYLGARDGDSPCSCEAGDKATFSTYEGIRTGAEIKGSRGL